MECRIFDDYDELSAAAAELIIGIVERKPDAVLCFATGNSPVGTYKALAQKAKESGTDFSQCFCFGLDEWLGVPPEKSGKPLWFYLKTAQKKQKTAQLCP